MITEDQVVGAYRKALRLEVRLHRDEEETTAQTGERQDATADHNKIRLQYLAQETR